MGKIIYTNHKVINFLGFKVIDIWEDYIKRLIIGDEVTTTEFYTDEEESDN